MDNWEKQEGGGEPPEEVQTVPTAPDPISPLQPEPASRPVSARRSRRSPLRQDCPTDPYLIRGIAHPKSPWQWFLRRIYLEDKLVLFKEFCHGVDPEGLQDYQKVAWGVARKHFKFRSQHDEKARCDELEESRDEEVRRRAAIVWDEEAERNGTASPVFGGGRESSYLQDVKWAYEHWPTYVRRRGPGEWAIAREKELIENAPSQGAYGLILYAQEDLKKFQDLCKSVLTKAEVPNEKQNEEVEIDRSLAKLRAVVEGFTK